METRGRGSSCFPPWATGANTDSPAVPGPSLCGRQVGFHHPQVKRAVVFAALDSKRTQMQMMGLRVAPGARRGGRRAQPSHQHPAPSQVLSRLKLELSCQTLQSTFSIPVQICRIQRGFSGQLQPEVWRSQDSRWQCLGLPCRCSGKLWVGMTASAGAGFALTLERDLL